MEDIDIILKRKDFNEKWEAVSGIMRKFGYKIDPYHSQEFIGKRIFVSFLSSSDVNRLIKPSKLKLKKYGSETDGFYFNVSAKNYLDIYRKGLENPYRKKRKHKEDSEKIKLLLSITHSKN